MTQLVNGIVGLSACARANKYIQSTRISKLPAFVHYITSREKHLNQLDSCGVSRLSSPHIRYFFLHQSPLLLVSKVNHSVNNCQNVDKVYVNSLEG